MRGPEARADSASGGGRDIGRAWLAAVALLTRLPVDRRGRVEPRDIARGVVAFPIVGAGVGGLVAATAWALDRAFPASVAAAGAVAVGTLVTGALHLDGLADTADGYGARTREHALEIMRAHAIGSYGTTAIVVDLLLKMVTIAALAQVRGGGWIMVAAGALSRSAVGVVGTLARSARADGGMGSMLRDTPRPFRASCTAAIGIGIASAAAGTRGLLAGAAVAVASVLWAWRCRRRLGGITGDTLGATSEGTEVLALLVGLALR